MQARPVSEYMTVVKSLGGDDLKEFRWPQLESLEFEGVGEEAQGLSSFLGRVNTWLRYYGIPSKHVGKTASGSFLVEVLDRAKEGALRKRISLGGSVFARVVDLEPSAENFGVPREFVVAGPSRFANIEERRYDSEGVRLGAIEVWFHTGVWAGFSIEAYLWTHGCSEAKMAVCGKADDEKSVRSYKIVEEGVQGWLVFTARVSLKGYQKMIHPAVAPGVVITESDAFLHVP